MRARSSNHEREKKSRQARRSNADLISADGGCACLFAKRREERTRSTPPVDTAQYAGSDACKTCHEDLYTKKFETTPHYKTTLKGGHGCESCQGPGSEHVAGGGDVSKIVRFKDLSRQQATARCLTCHGDNEGQMHFNRSAHASNDVGCLDCHSPHHAKESIACSRGASLSSATSVIRRPRRSSPNPSTIG